MCAERNQSGVTLLELMVALLIGGTVFLGLGYVFAFNTGLWMESQARITLHADASRALEEIANAAGHASEYSIPEEGVLLLRFPPSPLGHPVPAETSFRLRDLVLSKDGKAMVPAAGDTSVGVAEFLVEPSFADANGVKVLMVRLKLFSRNGLARSPDTVAFETSVHARNLGRGTGAGSGKSTGPEAHGAAGAAAPGRSFF